MTKPPSILVSEAGETGTSVADACFEAMVRHASKVQGSVPARAGRHLVQSAPDDSGDEVYGARAIAAYWWKDPSDGARKRVYNDWHYYRDRKEYIGLYKKKGTLCLSKRDYAVWRRSQDRNTS